MTADRRLKAKFSGDFEREIVLKKMIYGAIALIVLFVLVLNSSIFNGPGKSQFSGSAPQTKVRTPPLTLLSLRAGR